MDFDTLTREALQRVLAGSTPVDAVAEVTRAAACNREETQRVSTMVNRSLLEKEKVRARQAGEFPQRWSTSKIDELGGGVTTVPEGGKTDETEGGSMTRTSGTRPQPLLDLLSTPVEYLRPAPHLAGLQKASAEDRHPYLVQREAEDRFFALATQGIRETADALAYFQKESARVEFEAEQARVALEARLRLEKVSYGLTGAEVANVVAALVKASTSHTEPQRQQWAMRLLPTFFEGTPEHSKTSSQLQSWREELEVRPAFARPTLPEDLVKMASVFFEAQAERDAYEAVASGPLLDEIQTLRIACAQTPRGV